MHLPATAPPRSRILLVDDSAEDRLLLVDFLRQQGYRLYVAEDGIDGYQKAIAIQPDLILLDVYMPRCDGLATCRRLKADEQTRPIPVIFLTAATLPQDRIAGLNEGAVDYVTKPFDFEEVKLRVGIHLNLARPSPLDTSPSTMASPAENIANHASHLDKILFASARKILHTQLNTPPNLAALAIAVSTNGRRLNEAFKSCVGVTVFDYLRELRLSESRRLLAESTLPIVNIAQHCGYSSQANFATAFRERFGLTPSEFRREPELDAPPHKQGKGR